MKNIHRFSIPFLAILLLVSVYLVTLKPVFLHHEGAWTRILTHASSVAVALRDAGMELESGVKTIPDLDAPVRWGMAIEVSSRQAISVLVHGEIRYVSFPEGEEISLQSLLAQAGIELVEGEWAIVDGVALAPDTMLRDSPRSLEIRSEIEFLVLENGSTTRYRAPGPTVGEALWQAGIILSAADEVLPAPATRIESIQQSPPVIEVIRSRPVTIHVDGKEVPVRAAGKTVGQALTRAGFALTGLDYSVPAEDESLPLDGAIRIVRVREEILREQSQIPFERETQTISELELDHTQVVQPGAYGIKESVIRIRYEDGVEISRTPEGEHVLLPPEKRIVGYGTKVVLRTVDTPDGSFEYYRAITVYATSYSPCRLGVTPPRCSYTVRSNKVLQKGMIAMVESWYFLFQGQPVYVDGYGWATVEDSGLGPNAPYWIDLAYLDDEYIGWHRNTTLYFLTPVPANVPWILP